MKYQCTQERFLNDVATHKMEVIRDEGEFRHVRFKRPGSSTYYFDLITWPGYLCYTGDMGTFVFSRMHDMFAFFRTDWQHKKINPSYWSEKLRSIDHGGFEEFDEEKFRRIINGYRVEWMREMRDLSMSKDVRRELWEQVDKLVLSELDETSPQEAQKRAFDFCWHQGRKAFAFDDLWEHNFKQYTFHFIWCCYALTWGIEQYDKTEQRQEPMAYCQ